MKKTAIPHPQGYVCQRIYKPLNITGRLEDPAWDLASWTDEFQDIQGQSLPRPKWHTRVKMLWDESYFYIGAYLEEPHIWATLTEHDSVIFHDNDFEVFIDPDGDNHNYYEYEINAFGTDWDLRLPQPYRDKGSAINEWEIPGLIKSVHVNGTINDPSDTDISWSIELAFPWNVLGEYANCECPPKSGDQWRVNFSRVQWDLEIIEGQYSKFPGRPEHNWVWSQQGAIDMHRPEMWGYVQFEESDKPFNPDPDWQIKCDLMQLYWKQRERMEKGLGYAANLAELSVLDDEIQMQLTEHGFLASKQGQIKRWTVRQDSLLTSEDS